MMLLLPSNAFLLCFIVLAGLLMSMVPMVVSDAFEDMLVNMAYESRQRVISCQEQALPDWKNCVGLHTFLTHVCDECYDTTGCCIISVTDESYYTMFCPELERSSTYEDELKCDPSCFAGCEWFAYLHMNCLYSEHMDTNLDCIPPEPSPSASPTASPTGEDSTTPTLYTESPTKDDPTESTSAPANDYPSTTSSTSSVSSGALVVTKTGLGTLIPLMAIIAGIN